MNLKHWIFRMGCVAVAATSLCGVASQAKADLRITEVMSSSGAGGTEDWFEVTNFGASAIDISGYRMDDSSASFASSAELLGDGFTSIGAGESVVFLEIDVDVATEIAAFKDFWFGASVPGNFKIGYYSGSGLSFSSNGDGVTVFDSVGNTAAPLVSFGAATGGSSFDNYDGSLTSDLPVSQVGVNGAFFSNNGLGNIASPGRIAAIPEPTAAAVLALAGLAGMGFRRRR